MSIFDQFRFSFVFLGLPNSALIAILKTLAGSCDKLISLLVVVSAMIARGRPCMDGYVRAAAAWRSRVVVADCAGRY